LDLSPAPWRADSPFRPRKKNFFRESKVFLKQPVADKRSLRIRQNIFVFSKTHGTQIADRQLTRLHFRIRGITHDNASAVAAQQFIKSMNNRTFSVQVEGETIQRKLVERDIREAFNLNAQHGGIGRPQRMG